MFSGSKGNCTHIECDGTEILIDAGVSNLALCGALERIGTSIDNISAILITHEHSDHVKGLDPILKNYNIPVFINMESAIKIAKSTTAANFIDNVKIRNPGESITLGKLCIDIYKTPHDAVGSVCFHMLDTYGSTLGYATDIGYVTRGIANALIGCETVVFESNHDIEMLKNGSYPAFLKKRILSQSGHLSNDDCSRFIPHLVENGASKIWLAHLSESNNTPELALSTSLASLERAGLAKQCELVVAPVNILKA